MTRRELEKLIKLKTTAYRASGKVMVEVDYAEAHKGEKILYPYAGRGNNIKEAVANFCEAHNIGL